MSDCSENINPLQHNGTSQAQRLLPGLDPAKFALADEKDYADWIVFAAEFARYLNYYDTGNELSGNWQVFFNSDISAQLGLVAIQDINRYRTEIRERFDFIRNDDNKSQLTTVKIKLNELFSAILTLSKALDLAQRKLPGETSLKASILNIIETKLAPALRKLIAYHAAADSSPLNYLDHSSLSNWKILNQPLTDASSIISGEGLSSSWITDKSITNWTDYVNSIGKDDSIFNNPLVNPADSYERIEHAANHNLFTGLFDTFLTYYTGIVKEANAELLRTLESYDAHPAHYALFLSFLRLFVFAKNHINTITRRHLDFYYREVLKLQPRPAVANKVHILGELAKQVDEYLLAAGTGLKAGKDSLGKDVAYALNADAVFNKAKAAQLKTFYYEDRAFASPVTNSEDGLGAGLTSAGKEWHPYVHKVYEDGVLKGISMPKAQLGFALASHYLYLTEGERKVFIRLVTNPASMLVGKHIDCRLTTEKGWYKVNSPVISSTGKKFSDNITACSEISFTIPGSDPAIVNYNQAVHGGTFNCELPVLKIYLINEDNSAYEYDLLKDTTVTNVEIRVEVGMDSVPNQNGIKNLLISNDAGPVDPSKPFMPFGSQPKKDASFIIGHKEIFSKKNASVKLNIEWAEISAFSAGDIRFGSAATPDVGLSTLSSGIWNPINTNLQVISSNYSNNIVDAIPGYVPAGSLATYEEDYNMLGPSSVSGFMKLTLNDGFGYQDFITDMSLYLIDQTKTTPTKSKPTEPYTPKIKSLYAGYSAFTTLGIAEVSSYNNRETRLFHLYPFGEGEQHKFLQPTEEVFLLPQFKHSDEGIPKTHIGEFYIGLEHLEAGQAASLLFQVLEGTTDPKLVKPEPHVHWSYLSDNKWIDFKSEEISDNTLDLVQSGIIAFAVPKEATTENTVLPPGFIWIRAAVAEAAEAVCKLLTVSAQASVATFADNNNAGDFLDTPLAAGTISKLKIPDASVKKLSQPYPSFGGRQKEHDDHFYIRVSERLRHKARAITVWDYEHLVLEEFPEIYKVKCLNHTQIDDGIYNEVRPGYVSVITIPSLQNRNDANPLKPYTQQSTLTNIENFLKKKTSCFVNLRAAQPQFEEVRLEFSLKLYEQYRDFTFYSEKLKEEITQFLSPWAFGNASSLDFGGKVYKSVLINFIEERYYVDFITDVFMYVKINELTVESGDRDEFTASTARSILVSAPASKHDIHEIIQNDNNTTSSCPEA
jgi:hypothetical protein